MNPAGDGRFLELERDMNFEIPDSMRINLDEVRESTAFPRKLHRADNEKAAPVSRGGFGLNCSGGP
jgi:hypothetical protein